MQKTPANALIQTHATRNIMDIASHFFAKISHLVDEGDFHGEKGICGVFGEFRRFEVCNDDRRFNQMQGAIDFTHDPCRTFAFVGTGCINPDDHAIRAHEISDSVTFSEEFRI